MNREKNTDLKTKEPLKTTERRAKAQEETPPDEDIGPKTPGTLPAMGDAD